MHESSLVFRLSSARMVIECAFGRLKARFGASKREMDINCAQFPQIINACFVLHNFCEIKGEKIGGDHVTAALTCDREFQQALQANRYTLGSHDEAAGKQIRKTFMKYFE